MWKWVSRIFIIIAALLAVAYFSADEKLRKLITDPPTDRDVLFWTVPQRDALFPAMDLIPFIAQTHTIEAGESIFPLPKGNPLNIDTDIAAYMRDQRTAGLVIVQDGKIRLEEYGFDFSPTGRWTSFSVAKSFTSTLVGAAIKDGYIKSVDDKVVDYIPDLKGSVYDQVSIRQLLTMTSGVKWNEDYLDRTSDVARFNNHTAEPGVDATVSYMRTLSREAPAGSKWVYKTGETNLIGVLVSSATGMDLSDYLSEKIWSRFGMEQDATWLLGSTGHEISGCCIQASTRDYARFGLFMLGGAMAGGESVLSEEWIAAATTRQADIGFPGKGYGYQWWTYDDGSYAAQGIFGQGIFIDPKRKLVIASNSNWPKPTDYETVGAQRDAFYKAVQSAVDAQAH